MWTHCSSLAGRFSSLFFLFGSSVFFRSFMLHHYAIVQMVKKNREKSVLKHGEYTHIHVSIDFYSWFKATKCQCAKILLNYNKFEHIWRKRCNCNFAGWTFLCSVHFKYLSLKKRNQYCSFFSFVMFSLHTHSIMDHTYISGSFLIERRGCWIQRYPFLVLFFWRIRLNYWNISNVQVNLSPGVRLDILPIDRNFQ